MSIFRSLYADISEGEKKFRKDVSKMTVTYPFYKCMEAVFTEAAELCDSRIRE